MSHFPVLVLTTADSSDREAVHEEVARLLAPYDEGGECFAEGSRWDWWQIGGRFSGSLDGYDPAADPANIESCDLCHGTGTRTDWRDNTDPEWIADCNGCNGCRGTGRKLKWPSSWAEHPGDILPLAQASALGKDFTPSAVVTPDGTWHEEYRMGWWGLELERSESPGDWLMRVQRLCQEHSGTTAVIVDCHV